VPHGFRPKLYHTSCRFLLTKANKIRYNSFCRIKLEKSPGLAEPPRRTWKTFFENLAVRCSADLGRLKALEKQPGAAVLHERRLGQHQPYAKRRLIAETCADLGWLGMGIAQVYANLG
jgi:hypothetical protein